MAVAAIFDLDDTILDGSSGRMFLRYLQEEGLAEKYIRRRDMARFMGGYFLSRVGLVDVTRLLDHMARLLAGTELDEMWRLARHWYSTMLAPAISRPAVAQLDWHRSQGHIPLICSGSSQFAVLQVAAELGVDHTIFTEWESQAGYMTGTLRKPIVYGQGKVFWATQWAKKHQVDLSASYFYSDHISDEPLLNKVAHPVAVNPDKKLTQLALRRGWPIERWSAKESAKESAKGRSR